MKIVHIGKTNTRKEIKHISELRYAGHEVYVPGDSTYEQLVRRIIDADEIHVWDADAVFELGMVYFYSVHVLHYKLGWVVKVFCDPAALPVFMQRTEPGLDHGERPACLDNALPNCVRCSDCEETE